MKQTIFFLLATLVPLGYFLILRSVDADAVNETLGQLDQTDTYAGGAQWSTI
jgi:hypothetical protein